MKMVLHILLKDLRRHCWEAALLILATAAWAWNLAHPNRFVWLRQREMLPIALFGLWFLITIRVVQGESLVGDREFWPTRPYLWSQLLAAKAIFLVLCLNGPLLIAQLCLLAATGIPFSISLLPGLLFLQLQFLFFFTFPAAAFAAVTESIVQWLLAAAGIFVFFLIVSNLPLWGTLAPALAGGEQAASLLGGALVALALLFAVVWQYERRRPWLPRIVLAAAIVLIPLAGLLGSASWIKAIAYPRNNHPPLRLTVARDGPKGEPTYSSQQYPGGDTGIFVSLTATAIEPDTIVRVEGARFILSGDNGWSWQSPWVNRVAEFAGTGSRDRVEFMVPAAEAGHLSEAHINISAELAMAVYRLGKVERVETASDTFAVPEVGVCRWRPQWSERKDANVPDCVAPLRRPAVMVTSVESGDETCPTPEGQQPLPARHRATYIEWGSDLPADFDPNPVHLFRPVGGIWEPRVPFAGSPDSSRVADLCRGTPFTLRTGSLDRRMRVILDLGPLGQEKPSKVDEPFAEFRDGPE